MYYITRSYFPMQTGRTIVRRKLGIILYIIV